jgi:hypothetical protein
MYAQAPDGRRLEISRTGRRWAVSIQSSPRSELRLTGRDLANLLSQATGAAQDQAWVRELAARADKQEWRPLAWRRD